MQGNQQRREESRVQINDLEHKEDINSQLVQNEEMRIQEYEEKIRRLWDISKCANIRVTGMSEGEEEEQEIENLFEKK